jgi:hypothetical protein
MCVLPCVTSVKCGVTFRKTTISHFSNYFCNIKQRYLTMHFYDLLIIAFISISSALTRTGCRSALFRECGGYHGPWYEPPPPPTKFRFFRDIVWSFSVHSRNFRTRLAKAYYIWGISSHWTTKKSFWISPWKWIWLETVRYNEELYKLLKVPDLLKYVKVKRLQGATMLSERISIE